MKADLHVHSYHSGFANHLRIFRTRDCYSTPGEIYRTAKARGMDLVALTDHDSFDGCLEFLDRHPDASDFIPGEEITTATGPVTVHLGALGMNERIHRELQPLRGSLPELTAYLRSEGVFTTVNHLFFYYRSQVDLVPYLDALLGVADAVETRNGAMLASHNELTERIRSEAAPVLTAIGGSDAHTLNRVATTWTRADATDRDDFLRQLRAGRTIVEGAHGGTLNLAANIYGVIGNYVASLAGMRRNSLDWPTRAFGLVCSALSIPIQFVPLLVAAFQKSGEARRVAQYDRAWAAGKRPLAPPEAVPAAERA